MAEPPSDAVGDGGVPVGAASGVKLRRRAGDSRASRFLVVCWCVWLLAAWGATLWVHESLTAVRWMVVLGLLGMMLVYPMWRLSVASRRAVGAKQVLLDWMSLNLVFQAVLWPIRLTVDWSLAQVLVLAGVIAGWSLVTAGALAWSLGARRPGVVGGPGGSGARVGRPTVGMLFCVLVLCVGPGWQAFAGWLRRMLIGWGMDVDGGVVAWLGGATGWSIGPVEAVWRLTMSRESFGGGLAGDGWMLELGAAWVIAVLGWLALVLASKVSIMKD